MINLNNKFVLSKRVGCYKTYLRRIGAREYYISNNINLIYILEGQLDVEEADKLISLKTRDVYSLAPNQELFFQSNGENLIYVLQLIPECLEKIYDFKERKIYTGLILEEGIRQDLAYRLGILLKNKIYRRYDDDYIKKIIGEILAVISIDNKRLENINLNKGITATIIDITKQLPQMIIEGRDLRLISLANQYNISYYHLSKKFKEIIGINYVDYLTYVQMNMFTDMLINTNYSIVDIALNSGYKNVSNLNKDFKEFFGVTPTELRKRYKEEIFTPMYSKKSVVRFLNNTSMLESLYNDKKQTILDMRNITSLSDSKKDYKQVIDELNKFKDFIEKRDNTRIKVILKYSDYYSVLNFKGKEELISIMERIKEILSLCQSNRIELNIDFKL